MLTVGSLFSGIGGLELGFERAGFEVRWQVEIDPWCRKVLTKHWPSVPKYEDVRNVGAHNLEWVDVIVGGFPCQDISIAGKGAGLEGTRSGLWSEYIRIVRATRPRYVVVENVSALLHRGLDVVLRDLAQSGYDAEWQVLPAAAFGAPHRRDRVFIVANTNGNGRGIYEPHTKWLGETEEIPAEHRSQPYSTCGIARTSPVEGEGVANRFTTLAHTNRLDVEGFGTIRQQKSGEAAGKGLFRRDSSGSGTTQWAVEPPVGRVANGVPRRVDRLRGLGNAVVPQVAQYVAECVKAHAEADTFREV